MPEYSPDDPREWLRRAQSNLAIAKADAPGSCFEAQQAAERAFKALLIWRGVDFPFTHDLAQLLTLVQKVGQPVPDRVKKAAQPTRFAVFTRYPGIARPVSRKEYEQALVITEEVIRWVESVIPSL